MIESADGRAAVQFLPPGKSLDAAMDQITTSDEALSHERLGQSGLATSPALSGEATAPALCGELLAGTKAQQSAQAPGGGRFYTASMDLPPGTNSLICHLRTTS